MAALQGLGPIKINIHTGSDLGTAEDPIRWDMESMQPTSTTGGSYTYPGYNPYVSQPEIKYDPLALVPMQISQIENRLNAIERSLTAVLELLGTVLEARQQQIEKELPSAETEEV